MSAEREARSSASCFFGKGKAARRNEQSAKRTEVGRMDAVVRLVPLEERDREQFIRDNQRAFYFGAVETFGVREERLEEEGEIISRETVIQSIREGEPYRIVDREGAVVGGVVLRVDGERGVLDLLFVSPEVHSRGIGQAAWQAVEILHPEVKVWETVTPYFEQRNIHFYVNRCGFHIVEFFNRFHPDPNDPETAYDGEDGQFPEGMFRFEKNME